MKKSGTFRLLRRTPHNHFRHLVLCVLHRRKLAPSRFGMLQGFSILPRSAARWLTRKRREVIPSRIGQLRISMQAGRTRRNEMWTDAICVAGASVHVCALNSVVTPTKQPPNISSSGLAVKRSITSASSNTDGGYDPSLPEREMKTRIAYLQFPSKCGAGFCAVSR